MISAVHNAAWGIQVHLSSMVQTGHQIAATAPGGDLAGNLVQLKIDQHAVEANAAVLKTAEEMTGTLIDILA